MKIPIIESYRGVGIHDFQTRERIDAIVKPAIDEAFNLDELQDLVAYAGDVTKPPEARLLAEAKVVATFEQAVDERRARPDIDIDHIHASTAGLDVLIWANPHAFASLLDGSAAPGLPRPAERDPHNAARLMRAQVVAS